MDTKEETNLELPADINITKDELVAGDPEREVTIGKIMYVGVIDEVEVTKLRTDKARVSSELRKIWEPRAMAIKRRNPDLSKEDLAKLLPKAFVQTRKILEKCLVKNLPKSYKMLS